MDEAQTRVAMSQTISGNILGVRWQVVRRNEQIFLNINDRSVQLHPDELGSFTTHAVTGRWRNLQELAQVLIKYHPDISPLATQSDGNPPIA